MRLADYLRKNKIKRQDFARQVGVSGGWITVLCDGDGWPSRQVAERISQATCGQVTADDFLPITPPDQPSPATEMVS